ncbi:MAG: metallophosphoesterase family protein [Flavobacteriaceae bacterium]|nr:metallophosphoesterase family protein [Flavobacteriaceae bacterium]
MVHSKIILLSDIHGNLTAFESVLQDIKNRKIDDFVFAFLGDNINYGLRSNEVISLLSSIDEEKVIARIRGNHEDAVENDAYHRFSSSRGAEALRYTKQNLSEQSKLFIKEKIANSMLEIEYLGKKLLFVHGSLKDTLWHGLKYDEMQREDYKKYDFVFSGHTHHPQFVEIFYEDEQSDKRGKKKTIFINPGSVGQPRNHCNQAQYAVVDVVSEECSFYKVAYDIQTEYDQFNNEIDKFYIDRLKKGI